ncbi:hypothetical protein A5M85_12855 [Cellulophaga lytica]|nr:hypothetical protein A5M85_12855 [Cellulophaga lytica]
MRIFLIFFCTTVFGLTPNEILSQNAKVSIDADKVMTVDEIFNLIMNQTDYNFVYQVDMFKNSPKVPLEKGSIKVNTLLNKALEKGDYIVYTDDNNILIKKAPLQQTITVRGIVKDKRGLPVSGITILVTDRQVKAANDSKDFFIRGTATDFDGNFTIKAEIGNYIAVTGIGYEYYSKQISKTDTNVTVILNERASKLDEVVLIGYGSTTREQVSSAISSVKSESIVQNVIGNASFDRSLSGLVKGVQVQQNSGKPGANVNINIRGVTSPFGNSDNNPLFIIDGVPFQVNPTINFNSSDETAFAETPNPLLGINPQDIKSIDVLKDAAATAIYGSRGANGVIIVNTKKGNKGEKTQVSLSTSTTISKPINTIDWLNADEFKEFSDVYVSSSVDAANAGQIQPFALQFGIADLTSVFDPATFTFQTTYNGLNPDYFGNANTNWNDVVYRNAAITNKYDLSIRGGSSKSSYFMSLGYTDQEGLLREDEFKQYNVRLGVDNELAKNIKVGINTNLGYTNNFSGYDNINSNLNTVLNARPDYAPKNEEGEYIYAPARYFGFFDQESANPLAFTTGNRLDRKSYTALGNVYIESEVLKNLTVKGQVNGSYFFTDNDSYTPDFASTFGKTAFSAPRGSANSILILSKSISTSITTDITTSYRNTFGNHNVSGLLGFSWQRDNGDRNFFLFQGFPDDNVLTTSINAERVLTRSNTRDQVGLNSIFARASYNFKNKYFLTGNLRRDKSSRFGPNNQEAYFPSVSASWNIANEEFLKGSNSVNILRLRGSLGEVGSNNTGNFLYLQFFERGSRGDGFYNGLGANGLNNTLPNTDIRWEVTKEFNIGLDYALFSNRLRGSIDIYNRKTTDALFSPPFAIESGLGSFTSNFADVSNKGFELEISGDLIQTKDFVWSAGFNISKNKNVLEKYDADGLDSFLVDRFEVGKEIGLTKGYVVEGIFQTQEEVEELNAAAVANGTGAFYQRPGTGAGDFKYKDLNEDGVINDEDREILGSPQPDFFGGFNSTLQYKGFELSAFFNFVSGTESVFNTAFNNPYSPEFGVNVERRFSHPYRWSPTNTDAKLPRLVSGDPNQNNRVSTNNVYDSSYLRLRNVQLKYNFNAKVLETLGLSNLSIFLSGSNLKTWTSFPGIDPEGAVGVASSQGTLNSQGYPNAKSWSFGVNVNF